MNNDDVNVKKNKIIIYLKKKNTNHIFLKSKILLSHD